MDDIEKLTQAIAAIEAQRELLGESVVTAALGPLREKLAALSAAPAGAPAGQRKYITVLFADVSGFTALAETLDAEDLRDLINTLWQRLDQLVATYGGKVDKHIGDAMMALWGSGEAHEDEAEQAVRAALAMQAELRSLAATQRHPLHMRIGLSTGLVLLGAVGTTGEYTAIGSTVNLAARLEQAAPVGEVLISHDTYRQVYGIFDVLPQAPLSLKGRAEPLQTYLVQRARPRAARLITRGVEGVETRLVGRAAKMARLQAAFTACCSERIAQLVTVVGEAGLGKSRLMQEFLAWGQLSPIRFRLFRGRSAPSTSSSPYALLRDMLAFRFEIQESDPLPAARARLEQGLAALLLGDPQALEKSHFIGHLLGWDFSASPFVRGLLADPLQIRTLALHFLTLFFAAVAQEQPVVILLEDLHWADQGSLDALRHVLGGLPAGTPLFAFANTRPSLFERCPAWSEITQVRVDLQPLTASDSAALVADILRYLPELPAELSDLIVGQAEGNPFYLEELIKMLVDEKVIQPGAGAWCLTAERLPSLHVPPKLAGVLQARLDSLPPAERLALQQAAVIGRTFWDSAVQALDPAATALDVLHATLDAAQGRELLYRSTSSAFAGTCEYRFKHALLRDVAYETVLKRDRPVYHARAAAWLEAVCGARRSEYLPLLAEHHVQAGHSGQAAALLSEAGAQAARVCAFAEAAAFYRRSLALAPGVSAWWRELGEAYYQQGDFPAVQEAVQQALACAAGGADRAAALALLAEMLDQQGNDASALAVLDEALPLARAGSDQLTLCRVLYALGTVQVQLGNPGQARAALSECLALASTLGEVTYKLYAINDLGVVAAQQGLGEAQQYFQEVYTLAGAIGSRKEMASALNNLGELAKARQDYAAARQYHQQALALERSIGAQPNLALILLNLADDDIHLGQLAAARSGLRQGLALALQLGVLPAAVVAVTYFGMLAYAEGQIGRALALWGLARRQQAWSGDNQREMDQVLALWGLDPAEVQTGLAQGAALDWDETVTSLLDG